MMLTQTDQHILNDARIRHQCVVDFGSSESFGVQNFLLKESIISSILSSSRMLTDFTTATMSNTLNESYPSSAPYPTREQSKRDAPTSPTQIQGSIRFH